MEKDETSADVNFFNLKPSNSSKATSTSNESDEVDRAPPSMSPAAPARVPFNKTDIYYDMTGDKHLIIFNHRKYEKTLYFNFERPTERTGTECDVKSLKETFGSLGFKPFVHNDLKHADILKVMSQVCKEDHRGTSCIAVAIMTHGGNGEVYAADRPYFLNDIASILQNGDPGLVGKPKLLFVQACRGGHMDRGRQVQTDGRQNIVLPTHSDTLIVYSSTEHYLAYRDSEGSWLMQALCDVIDNHHRDLDLVQMLTFVHQTVAYRATNTPLNPKTANKKQMPETKYTLTKLLKF